MCGSRLLCALLVLLLLSPAEVALGQGFSTFSGRNHPELDWRVAETEHFRIMYPARLDGIEAEAASVAEASYDALSENLDVRFDEKTRIYLSDEDEIANGFAVPVGNGYTNIWVHAGAYARTFTGREKWLRKVIAHELAHIFHYRATRSGLGFWAYLFGNPLPRFWTEGLAQYETETWDAQRGDRWLRTAVLGADLSYEDGRSLWNGRLLYAVGNSQVRYFAEQYGDSTLARLLDHRKDALLGLAEVHDFDAALEATTGKSYREFYDDWRRHVSVYYYTLAGQLEPVDSLHAAPLDVPGRYLYDVQFSQDTSRMAVLALPSPRRPVTRLHVVDVSSGETEIVAEGPISAPVAWSPDGRRLAFSRTARGRYGSLLNDLFLVEADGSGLRRLTRSRRAASPTFSPDGQRLAFVGSADGTANLFLFDLETGEERPVTDFTGDVQILSVRWHPSGDTLAFARFAPDGTRDLVLLDLATGALTPLTGGAADNRLPVWSPDGSKIAFTSLRDGVPNVFVYDLAQDTSRRVTHLAVGAAAHDWLPPDSAHAAGSLVVVSTTSKERDRAFRIDAGRTAPRVTVDIPEAYTGWTTHRPPREVPPALTPDASLVTRRYAYNSWENITHVASLALPYYFGPDDAGLFGLTSWTEPLGKHLFAFAGGLSVADPGNSFFLGSYSNNQLRPTLTLSGYRLPGAARLYGDELLVENIGGGDLAARWPLDWRARPFVATTFGARLRYVDVTPLDLDAFDDLPETLAPPEAGQQLDLRLALTRRKQRPYQHNAIHPLDGLGARLEVVGAAPLLGGDSRFLRGDVAAFGVFESVGLQRLYLYGRAQAQTGRALPQDYLGFSRYDDVRIGLPGLVPLELGDAERVRGHRSYAVGNRVLFGTAEYRVPLLPDLQTELLGVVALGATALAAFADAGAVWDGADLVTRRLGVGLELKNALRIGRAFQIAHAVGLAQPAGALGSGRYEVYYRVRTALPFWGRPSRHVWALDEDRR